MNWIKLISWDNDTPDGTRLDMVNLDNVCHIVKASENVVEMDFANGHGETYECTFDEIESLICRLTEKK